MMRKMARSLRKGHLESAYLHQDEIEWEKMKY